MKKVSAVVVTFNSSIMLKELIDGLLNDCIRGKLGKNAGYLPEKEILC